MWHLHHVLKELLMRTDDVQYLLNIYKHDIVIVDDGEFLQSWPESAKAQTVLSIYLVTPDFKDHYSHWRYIRRYNKHKKERQWFIS
jgi:hypothetical protein